MTPNPVVDHLDDAWSKLHPLAKASVVKAFSPPMGNVPGGVQTLSVLPQEPAPHQDPIGGVSYLPPEAPAGEQPRPLARPMAATPSLPPTPYQAPEPSPAEARLAEAREPHGTAKIGNRWLRGLAQVGEGIGTGLFPGVAAAIPGSQLHQALLVRNAERGVEQESGLKSAESKRGLEEAETREHEAKANEIANPTAPEDSFQPLPGEEGYAAFNKRTGEAAPVTIGGKPVMPHEKPEKEAAPHYHSAPNGDVLATTYDSATGKYTTEKVYHGDPKVQTDVVKLEIGGEPHTVIVDKESGKTIKDLGKTGEKPPNINVNQGSWQLDEDAQGHSILFNPKTGETKPAPGIQKPGTAAKQKAATEKEFGPSRAALEYAHSYLQNGVFTGAGDEALQEKFFELAKPATGFRMTQPQMNMLQNSRSWIGSAEAHIRHATSGKWFSDEQRQQIAKTMEDLAAAKEKAAKSGSAGETANGEPPVVRTKEEFDRLPSGTVFMEDGHKYRKP